MAKIFIADDHRLYLEGIATFMSQAFGHQIIGKAYNGQQAIEQLANIEPDLILLDVDMPLSNGLEVTRWIKQHKPALPILIMTMHHDAETARRFLEEEVAGYILKTAEVDEVHKAIEQIINGSRYWSARVLHTLYTQPEPANNTPVKLTRREKEVLKLLLKECTTHQIAEKLFISPYTVESHRKNLLSKFGVKSTIGLVKSALEMELVS